MIEQKNQIKIILEDLYALDGSLRQYEPELEKLINEIISQRPDTEFDENFAARLKTELMERAQSLKFNQGNKTSFWRVFSGAKFSYALSGALAIALILVGVYYFASKPLTKSDVFSLNTQKTIVNDNAFGSLKQLQPAAQSENNSGSAASSLAPQAFGRGGGGGGGTGSTLGMPAPDFYSYKFVYRGEPLVLDQDKVEVLRRVKGVSDSGAFWNLLKQFSFGIDLASFGNAQVQNINFAQDQDHGYLIFVDFVSGEVTINENWNRWPQPYANCRDEKCYQENLLKPSDAPSNDQLIEIADNFIKEYGVDLSSYGLPEVMEDWGRIYAKSVPESQIIVPDTMSVIYPLMINGQSVYDSGGGKVGVTVAINLREKRVSSMYGLSSQRYEASLYDAEQDASKILKIVEQGSLYGPVYGDGSAREIKVGTPEKGYLMYWNYVNNSSDMLYVPALIFPIVDAPQDAYYYPRKIVVPLAKELLEQNNGGGPIRIM